MDEILKQIADLDKQRGDLVKKMDGLGPVTKDDLAALKKELDAVHRQLTLPATVYLGSLPMTDISVYGTTEWIYKDSILKPERPVLTK